MRRVAIVGAGIAGITAAFELVRAGFRVDLFENGGEIPYPHSPQYLAEVVYADRETEIVPRLPDDIKRIGQSGDYSRKLDDERIMCVGGQASRWFGVTPRFRRESFRPKTLHGFGEDWPISYDDLEPYYLRAERHLGISGAEDNPFAAPRSAPFPLPPFELGWQDLRLADRLKASGLTVHTTPQARVRHDYDERVACENYGVCETCPVGARYSPNHHLEMLRSSNSFELHTRCLVRRVIVENGRARGIVYHADHGPRETEHRADIVIVAAGALESARLLLLSRDSPSHPDGLGNASGQLGRNLGFHHVWWGRLEFPEPVMPGRAGPPTMLSHQFSEGTREHGGILTELFDRFPGGPLNDLAKRTFDSGSQVVEAMRPILNLRSIGFHAETRPSSSKLARLGTETDRFGDPFLDVHYALDDFDRATFERVLQIGGIFAGALGATFDGPSEVGRFWSGHHHLGTCRMGHSASDSVVDPFGAVHGVRDVYVCGGSTFVTVTAFQPTLTIVASTMRTVDRIVDAD